MRSRVKEYLLLAVGLAIIGLVVLVSGIVPIKASSDHWPITRWVLDFASSRSVSFHSRTAPAPELDSREMIVLGAATYDNNCRWCHGVPGLPQPVVASQMTPHPPDLSTATRQWSNQELFYILKHGIKFAGMPAWASEHRDSGIWPVVAFLRRMENMDGAEYQDLLAVDTARSTSPGDAPIPGLIIEQCAACHGVDGVGRAGDLVPKLAGQSRDYLRSSLVAYQRGIRHSGVMQPIAARLRPESIEAVATYYADLEPAFWQADKSAGAERADSLPSDRQQSDALTAVGYRLATAGDRHDKIASCVDCHGPGDAEVDQEYPRLVGQSSRYLDEQLRLFRDSRRGGLRANLMHPTADNLSDQQIEALAAFYSQQPAP
jgi:cytochrome c553